MSQKIFDTANAVSVGEFADLLVSKVPVTIDAKGLAAGETISVLKSPDGGATWQPLPDSSGNPIEFTDTITQIAIYSPMRLSFSKGVTAGSAGVYVSMPWSL